MTQDAMGGLFGADDDEVVDEALEPYEQDGPDLFGTETDELILPSEPVPVDDPEMDLPEDAMDEIPIDPDGENPDEGVVLGGDEEPREEEQRRPAYAAEGNMSAPIEPAQRGDAPLALYRRYRPDTFDDVIGQDHVTEPLRRALANNRVNHAYLFSGPRGCGKTTSARILARCLNCEQGPTPTPCGTCRSCTELARGGSGSIDVIEIDAASHGGVDEARDLRERAFFAPVASRYKIYIIDEAHMVTTQGFNALLKVVEEPPPHVKFIFATTEPEKVIGTIRSRTHHYPFRLVPPKTLTTYLSELCEAEGVAVDASVLPLVVRAGAGSVRDSLSVLDQLLGGASEAGVSYGQATALLGYTPDSLLDEIMDAFAAGDAHGVFACIDKVIEVGQDPRRFAEDLLRRLRDLIVVAAVPDALATGLVEVADDQGERLTTQANGMGRGELTRAAEVMAKGLTDMRGTTAPRLHLELMCSRVLLPGADVDGRGVHARLDRIERRLQMAAGADTHAARPEPPTLAGDGQAPTSQRASAPSQAQPSAPREPAPERRATPVAADPSPAVAHEPAGPASGGNATPQADPWAAPWPESEPTTPLAAPASAPPESPAATARPAPDGAQQADTAGARPAGDPAVLTTAQVRSQWPEVLEAIKGRRRVTWITVRENAQLHSFADGVLTLAFNNAGARESFARGGSEQYVREAVLQVLGVAPTIQTIADEGISAPGAQTPAAEQPRATAPGPSESADGQRDQIASRGAEQARANLRASSAERAEEDEVAESRDDLDLDDVAESADELLAKHLGAELIGEEEPTS